MSDSSGDRISDQYAMILPWIIPMMLILLIILHLLEKRENVNRFLLISLLSLSKLSGLIFRSGTLFMVINRYGFSVNGFLIYLALGSVIFLVMELGEKKITDRVLAAIKKKNQGLTTGKKSD